MNTLLSRMRIALGFCVMPFVFSFPGQNFEDNASNLSPRASTCPDQSYNQCSQALGVPSTFCCPSANICISLAANTTVICCPTGQTCNLLKPVTCDLSAQNATLHPENTLKTIAFNNTLPACGGECCPFGYSCNAAGNCVMDADQNDFVVARAGDSVSVTTSSSGFPTSTGVSVSPSKTAPIQSSSSAGTTSQTPISADSHHIDISIGTLIGIILSIIFSLALFFGLLFWFLHRKVLGFRLFTRNLRRSVFSYGKAELDAGSMKGMRVEELHGEQVFEKDGRGEGEGVVCELEGEGGEDGGRARGRSWL